MKRILTLATLAAAITIPAAHAATRPPYFLTDQIEAAIQENGLTVTGRHHAVLYAGCTGQGYAGSHRTDKYGVPEPTYHLFLCLVSVTGSKISEIHIETLPGGRYRWTKVF